MDPLAFDLLDLWFGDWTDDQPPPEDGDPQFKLWFGRSAAVDEDLRRRFGDAARDAREGRFDAWRDDPAGCVALVLLLDQMPRNIWRDTPDAFGSDAAALAVAKGAIAAGLDRRMPFAHRCFLYMPLMHSEVLADHDIAERKFGDLVTEAARVDSHRMGFYKMALDYELKHRAVVERFGRYPHRNRILARDSTPEELVFLQQPGSSF